MAPPISWSRTDRASRTDPAPAVTRTTYPVPRAYCSKRPPRYLARKRSAAAIARTYRHLGHRFPVTVREREAALVEEPARHGEVVQGGRKVVTAFALEGDFDPATLASNTFEIEWPPRSGVMQS